MSTHSAQKANAVYDMKARNATTTPTRRAAMALLRAGYASLSEVAALAGVTKQNVHIWCKTERLDWQPRRRDYLTRLWARRLSRM